MFRPLWSAISTIPARLVAWLRGVGRSLRWLATDRTARPMIGYLLSMGLGGASVLLYVINGGNRPETAETALLLAAMGVVMLTLLTLGGGRPREQ